MLQLYQLIQKHRKTIRMQIHFRVLNGSKIREPNRTEPKTEPNRTDEKTEILPTNYIDSKNCCEWLFTSFGFQFGSKILEMPWGIHISKVSVRFSSVLNSVQLGFRFDFRFRTFSNCCNNKLFTLTWWMKNNSQTNYFNFSSVRESANRTEPNRKPNRTENRRKKPNRWRL